MHLLLYLQHTAAKYIIDLHHSHQVNHDRREFGDRMSVCNEPIISSQQAQTVWECDKDYVGKLGYPRQTRCTSQCLAGYTKLHGTANRIECVDRKPQYGQSAREWNPKPLFCKPNMCNTSHIQHNLTHTHGIWYPQKCGLQQRVSVGTICRYRCHMTNSHKPVSIVVVCDNSEEWNVLNFGSCHETTALDTVHHAAVQQPRPLHEATEQQEDYYYELPHIELQHNSHELVYSQISRLATTKKRHYYPGTTDVQTIKTKGLDKSTAMHRNMHNIVSAIFGVYSGPSRVTIILITVLVVVIIALILAICITSLNRRNGRKYAIVDERGHRLLPLRTANENLNNNTQSSGSQTSISKVKGPHQCSRCPKSRRHIGQKGKCRYKSFQRRHCNQPASNYSDTSTSDSERPLLSKPVNGKRIKEVKLVLG